MPKLSTSRPHPNTIVRQRMLEAGRRESIHENGAKRHREQWLVANQRAVDAARAKDLDPSQSPAREAIPNIVMRVLDGFKFDSGLTWDAASETWIPRTPTPPV